MKFIIEKIQYDKENDILYYTNADKTNSYGDEDPDNIVIMRDIDTEVMTGITILNFARMYQNNDYRIKKLVKYFDVVAVAKMFDL